MANISSRICGAVSVGSIDHRNIASPATAGEAIDVPDLFPACEPNRCENTSSPTVAMLPFRFEVVDRQPGSNAGEPVSRRFSTAAVFRSGVIGSPNWFSRSERSAAADQRLFLLAGPAMLPADVAWNMRSSSPADPRTSCAQSEPLVRASASSTGTSKPRLVLTTTRPLRLVAFWKIFTPVICVERPPDLDHVQRRRRREDAGDVAGGGAVRRESGRRNADHVIAVLGLLRAHDEIGAVVGGVHL